MADWGLLAGLGGGLTALGEGLNERELRKMAEEERRLQRQRQAEQDALAKAQAASGEFRQMDALNFRPASNTDVLNNLALQRGQTEFKSDVSGQTFLRDPGMSPSDLRMQNEQDKREAAMRQLQERAAAQAAIAAAREEGLNSRWQAPSGNVQVQEQGRNARWDRPSGNVKVQQAGANARAALSQGGAGGAGKKPTKDMADAGVFSSMMAAAEGELAKNPYGSKPFSAPTEIALKGDGKGLIGNAVASLARSRMTPEEQRAFQSRVQFAQAAIYAFSGKAVTEQEAARAAATFFPQSGETDPTVLDQKKRARDLAAMLLQRRASGEPLGVVPIPGTNTSALDKLNSLGRP